MTGRLQNKVAIISGAARAQGIGAAAARLFAKEGAKVAIGDIRDDEGKQTVTEISKSGGQAMYLHLDVSREEDWRKAIGMAVANYGRLDVLVSNAAGGGRRGANPAGYNAEATPVETWDAVMAINARGAFLGTKVAVPEMRKAGGGSIVITSSQLGIVGSDNNSIAYHASKGALRIFAKTAAIQYAKDNIRVNSVAPGPILTSTFDEGHDEARRQVVLSRVPLGRFGTPEEVAYAMLFLASDESSFVTGSELVIDGGWTAK